MGTSDDEALNEVRVSGYKERLLQWKHAGPERIRHLALMCCTLVTYAYALSVLDGRRELTSAAWREILGELYPDASKSAERLTEAEVVPRWAETLHADDITKNLNWFQTFCRTKYGMDDHISFFWQCDISGIKTQFDQRGLKPLDPSMNCSADFLQRHIIEGDDPRCVPWGKSSLESLGHLLEAEGDSRTAAEIAGVDMMYDEFTVHAGSPLFDSVQQKLGRLESEIGEIKALLLNQSGTPRRAAGAPVLRLRLSRHARRQRRLTFDPVVAEDVSEPYDGYDGVKGECDRRCSTVADAPQLEEDELPCRCFGEDGRIASTCRNHHWGLVHLCRPTYLSVAFEIKRIVCDQGAPIRCTPMLWFKADMQFVPIQGISKSIEPSGWYLSHLQLAEGKCVGNITHFQGIIGFLAAAFILWFLCQGPLWAILCFPSNFANVLELRRWKPPKTDSEMVALTTAGDNAESRETKEEARYRTLREEFEKRFARLLSGVGRRKLKYMARMDIVFENFGGLLILMGCCQSSYEMLSKYVDEFGAGGSRHDIRAWEYVQSHYTGFQLMSELLYQSFFDGNTFHTVAWFALYVTCVMSVFDSFEGTQWIPAVFRLGFTRLTYFLLAYCSCIFGFSLLFWLQFGARFIQFSTLKRAWIELFFLACGVPFHVFDDVNPYYDNNSILASCFLATYMVFVVIIGLNFFTTILLDAYGLAKKPKHADYAMQMTRRSMNDASMRVLGILRATASREDGSDSEMDFDPLCQVTTSVSGVERLASK